MEGNSQGRAQLELYIRTNLSLEVENFRALLTNKRVQSCTIACKQSLEAMTLWYTPWWTSWVLHQGLSTQTGFFEKEN